MPNKDLAGDRIKNPDLSSHVGLDSISTVMVAMMIAMVMVSMTTWINAQRMKAMAGLVKCSYRESRKFRTDNSKSLGTILRTENPHLIDVKQ